MIFKIDFDLGNNHHDYFIAADDETAACNKFNLMITRKFVTPAVNVSVAECPDYTGNLNVFDSDCPSSFWGFDYYQC